jgi:tagaturonate epimerase
MYASALNHVDELCAPYATVIDINREKLPPSSEVNGWTSEQFVRALRHIPSDPLFNSSLRQLLHVGFKLAAKTGRRYLDLLEGNAEVVGKNVTENIFARHLHPLLIG